MDDFDTLNQPATDIINTDTQEANLFGTDDPSNVSITNSLNNNALESSTWDTFSNAPSQANTFDSDLLNVPNSEPSYDEETLADQSNTMELPSFSEDNPQNNSSTIPTEETSSYEMFSAPVASTNNESHYRSTGSFSQENLSVLEAFNRRRQREIAEKDVLENEKIEALRQQAKNELDRWYTDRKLYMEQNRQRINRDEDDLRQKAAQKSDNNFCDWAKTIRYLEFSQGSQLSRAKRDLGRMRSSIINAKRDQDKRQAVN